MLRCRALPVFYLPLDYLKLVGYLRGMLIKQLNKLTILLNVVEPQLNIDKKGEDNN